MPTAINSCVSPSDLDLIQGSWYTIAGPKDCRLLISGNHYTFEMVDGDIYMGTFELQTAAAPPRMDMQVAAGPPDHQGQTACCIYQVDGDVLRWCATRPGSKCQLHDFPSIDNDCFLSLVFKNTRTRHTVSV